MFFLAAQVDRRILCLFQLCWSGIRWPFSQWWGTWCPNYKNKQHSGSFPGHAY